MKYLEQIQFVIILNNLQVVKRRSKMLSNQIKINNKQFNNLNKCYKIK